MSACRLHLFTWGCIASESGEKCVKPICPIHPGTPVHIEETIEGTNLIVSCTAEGKLHPVNMCSKSDFDNEKKEAENMLKCA
jgi:hypothetical protein